MNTVLKRTCGAIFPPIRSVVLPRPRPRPCPRRGLVKILLLCGGRKGMGFHCFVLPLRFNVDFRPGIKVSFVSLSIFSLIVSCGKL